MPDFNLNFSDLPGDPPGEVLWSKGHPPAEVVMTREQIDEFNAAFWSQMPVGEDEDGGGSRG